ncbi:hypothetical protein [Streptomyces sp. NBC_00691]|uniref:hypothetical protein n=1 Tax=Streptomyces sp. NBC_00691 TaxID=2903671 RepID=UPI002E2F0BD0|nr:hypothetical protein [Streptomyces sp. NBC_00691]
MDSLTAESIIAVVTALAGVLVSVAAIWVQWWVPRRRRIGYRVQLDTSIGAGAAASTVVTGPGATVRRGFFVRPSVNQASPRAGSGVGRAGRSGRAVRGRLIRGCRGWGAWV